MSDAIVIARGRRLQYFTLLYNACEAALAIAAGVNSNSVSLISFGLDSLIEWSASLTALWLLGNPERERVAQKWIALSLVLLAAGTAYEALAQQGEARDSTLGLCIAATSIVVMPWLAREKRKVARDLGSCALQGEAKQTDFCFYLSVILLAGLAAQRWLGLSWVDSVAALAMTPLMLMEARKSWRGEGCGCH